MYCHWKELDLTILFVDNGALKILFMDLDDTSGLFIYLRNVSWPRREGIDWLVRQEDKKNKGQTRRQEKNKESNKKSRNYITRELGVEERQRPVLNQNGSSIQ